MSIPSTDYMIELDEVQSTTVEPLAAEDKNAVTIYSDRNWYSRVFSCQRIKKGNRTLAFFRFLAIFLGLTCIVFDTIAFANSGSDYQKFRAVRFMVGGNYVYYEIAAMIYASGAAVFGTTIDFTFMLPLSIINCILVQINCLPSSRGNTAIFLLIRIGIFYAFVELCYRNFKKLSGYQEACRLSAHSMLRQTLLFSFTALFLSASGLRAVHRNTVKKRPVCPYAVSQCGLVELYDPRFTIGHPCEDDFIDYITSREELRIIRNFIYIHIAFYAMFNSTFLEISNMEAHRRRLLLLCFFALLSTSVVYSHVTPYDFLGTPKLFYDVIEILFFLLLLIILRCQLYKKVTSAVRVHPYEDTSESSDSTSVEKMKKHPTIMPGF